MANGLLILNRIKRSIISRI